MCIQVSLGIVLLFISLYHQVCRSDNVESYATQLLASAGEYLLFWRSGNTDTTFITSRRCVELSYIIFDDTSDIVSLDARGNKEHEWEPKLFKATINSTKKNIIHYGLLDVEGTEGTVSVYYRILHYHKDNCYIAQMIKNEGEATFEAGIIRNPEARKST
ncbi:uncharacterized protein LOC142571130 isoform X2 [Dermacentor variabilis]|uniref:uncharacterized protein LOC142571130 isoform X2 n=1 Tax=Dermacentor variabilis TaxID=34621 RepID=UPI003F5CAD73